MEILHSVPKTPVKAVLFDFDGTISTLRYGWEAVMRQMMLELIAGSKEPDAALVRLVDDYIEESTGIQTIFQMKWLAARVREYGRTDLPDDPWWYKDEYNRRLMRTVSGRVAAVSSGAEPREKYLIAGAARFLAALRARGVSCYVASGTDDADVRAEAQRLAAAGYPEIVVTGIHLASYGRGTENTLLDAIRAVAGAVPRVRLGSLEPLVVTEEFACGVAELGRVMPQFHLSMQSGSAGVLARMRRRYTPCLLYTSRCV